MKPANLLFILSDEHNPRVLGCAGHPMIRTPNLDRLAEKGVRFSDAYCNSPICVPSRAALATGRYVHGIRFWDNAIPYDGSVPSWHRRLREAGHEVTAIGKLHFRSAEDHLRLLARPARREPVQGARAARALRHPHAPEVRQARPAAGGGRGRGDIRQPQLGTGCVMIGAINSFQDAHVLESRPGHGARGRRQMGAWRAGENLRLSAIPSASDRK
jgi:arylsulfatase A-like enzyme